ncbi:MULTISPECIES: hypothetical protein [unclassified Luteimonas]
MSIQLQCRCRTLRGETDAHGTYAGAACYCSDCQAYAHCSGTPGLLDARGGTDIALLNAPTGQPVPPTTPAGRTRLAS